MLIVTHQNPDWDALMGCFQIEKFLAGNEAVEYGFINMAKPDLELLARADYVIDCGGEFDPDRGRFDHHQMGGGANKTCAAQLVYAYLNPKFQIEYLEPLIELVYEGDVFGAGSAQSRLVGIHALLSAFKHERNVDEEIRLWGFNILNSL